MFMEKYRENPKQYNVNNNMKDKTQIKKLTNKQTNK